MPCNLEIKAVAANWSSQLETAARLGDYCGTFQQRDTFFQASGGRLKLREECRTDCGQPGARLIFYQREDAADPSRSVYRSLEVADAGGMGEILAGAFGVLVTVSKNRELYLVGRTRVHFDHVCRLGCFIELEHPLEDDEDQSASRDVVENLMNDLGIAPGELVAESYANLLMNR